MYGTVTQYMGTAYTGAGISHKYDKLIASASQTIFLEMSTDKCHLERLE